MDITQAIAQAEARYYKLVLVVGGPGSGKTALLRPLSEQLKIPLLNLGLELSKKLLSLTVHERKLKASEIIADLLDLKDTLRLAVDNTEIIFDPSLMLNPLGLLQSVSRTRLLIWSWNGEVEDSYITYAYPGHPEHQRIHSTEMTLVTL
jgi:adenylate kinase family enzyme